MFRERRRDEGVGRSGKGTKKKYVCSQWLKVRQAYSAAVGQVRFAHAECLGQVEYELGDRLIYMWKLTGIAISEWVETLFQNSILIILE